MESCRDGVGGIPLSCESGRCGWLLSRGNIMIRSGRRSRRWRPSRAGCAETVRKWVRQAQIDAGDRPGVNGDESAEVRKLRAENRELRRANEIPKAAAGFFAG